MKKFRKRSNPEASNLWHPKNPYYPQTRWRPKEWGQEEEAFLMACKNKWFGIRGLDKFDEFKKKYKKEIKYIWDYKISSKL